MTDSFWLEQYRNKAASDNAFVASGRTEQFDPVEFLHSIRLVIDRLVLKRRDHLLNVGCANGLYEIVLGGICQEIQSVEIVPELAKRATKNLRDYDNSQVSVAGIDALPFDDGIFNKLLCMNVIQLISDREILNKGFAEFFRVMEAGGTALVADIPDQAHRDRILLPYLEGVRSSSTLNEDQKKEIIQRNESSVWYAPEDLIALANTANLDAEILALPKNQPHHDHRFDLVLRKKS